MSLQDCIQSLREIRARLNHVLDPSIRAEFDGVIDRLRECADQGFDAGQRAMAVDDVLVFLGRLIAVTTDVMYLIDRYRH